MIPTITQPTRINYIASILVEDMSDHLPTICVINSLTAVTREPLKICSRDTWLKNLRALKSKLDNHDWMTQLINSSPSENMEQVHTVLTSTIDRCIPLGRRIVNSKHLRREPWLTSGIKISIDRNKRLYAKMLRNEVDNTTYKKYNRELRKSIRNTKHKYYHDKCNEFKSQTKKLWGLINEISGKKSDKSTLIEYLRVGDIKEYGAK